MKAKRFYTDSELSELIGVATGTLANWRWKRRGPAWHSLEGGAIRYAEKDVEDWLARQRKAVA